MGVMKGFALTAQLDGRPAARAEYVQAMLSAGYSRAEAVAAADREFPEHRAPSAPRTPAQDARMAELRARALAGRA